MRSPSKSQMYGFIQRRTMDMKSMDSRSLAFLLGMLPNITCRHATSPHGQFNCRNLVSKDRHSLSPLQPYTI